MILILALWKICSKYSSFINALNKEHYSVSQEEYLAFPPMVWIVLRQKLCSLASDPAPCGLTAL